MEAESSIFQASNLPLLTEERKLAMHYNKIIGSQSVTWQGKEYTLQQLRPLLHNPEREPREQVWRLATQRQLADCPGINTLWAELLHLRVKLAENAHLPDYRAYRWRQLRRLDYTPQDCLDFHKAIEQVVVPVATRIYQKHQRRLGVASLRPWDLDLDLYPLHFPSLPSYGQVSQLVSQSEVIFQHIDKHFGEYFRTMRQDDLLDIENRKGKAPGAYCRSFPVAKRPFIFMNGVGLASDVLTLLHESGHAFHDFEMFNLSYAPQRDPDLEFCEVASMAMELLALPYIAKDQGGFYEQQEARRFQVELLEHMLLFWPYMAVVDAFQHWVYTHPQVAGDPANCDAQWLELWQRFIPGVDWGGLEDSARTGWHRKLHIYRYPFYYIEYGVAQLGAMQVWSNALSDQQNAVELYRAALKLGNTASLPEVYQAAGVKFTFDATTLQVVVNLAEAKIAVLEG